MSECPKCGKALRLVVRPAGSALNEDQFRAVRAGDWFCDGAGDHGEHGKRGTAGYAYFWRRELPPADERVTEGA